MVEDAVEEEVEDEAEDEEDSLQGMWISEVQMRSVFALSLTERSHRITQFNYLLTNRGGGRGGFSPGRGGRGGRGGGRGRF